MTDTPLDSKDLSRGIRDAIKQAWPDSTQAENAALNLPEQPLQFGQLGNSHIRRTAISRDEFCHELNLFVGEYALCRISGLIPNVDNTSERQKLENDMTDFLTEYTLLNPATAKAVIDSVSNNVDKMLREMGLDGPAARRLRSSRSRDEGPETRL